MRQLVTIFFSFLLFSFAKAQTPSDFFFENPVPEGCEILSETPAEYIGAWQSKKDTMRTWYFKKNKIYSQYKHVMILSKKEFQNAGYQLKENRVYGFSKTDSLPAIVKNDTIIFCYISEHEIIHYVKETENEFITILKNGLLLSQKIDSFYRYTLIRIEKGELVLSEVDHETKTKEIVKQAKPKITYNDENEPVLYLANLDKKALEKFISSGLFNDVQYCIRDRQP